MSADRLRQAARVLRERSEAATPGPWAKHEEHYRDYTDEAVSHVEVCATGPVAVSWTATSGWDSPDEAVENAAYIATVHPGVGLALADWLDAEADGSWTAPTLTRLADLILGGAS